MTMESSVASIPAAELATVVLQTLEQKGQSMTASQVRDSLPRRYRQQTAEIGRSLEDLAAQGRVHAWPAYRSKALRYATRPMDQAARAVLNRLLNEQAFTRSELMAAVRREVPGLEEARCGQLLDEVLSTGQVRKLPPRLGGSSNLLGTPQPRSYLGPLFDLLGNSIARLLPRLESEGISRLRMIEEAKTLWAETLRRVEEEEQPAAAPEPTTETVVASAPAQVQEAFPPVQGSRP
jgi:hypothetical protein